MLAYRAQGYGLNRISFANYRHCNGVTHLHSTMNATVQTKLFRYSRESELDSNGHRRPTKRAALAMRKYLTSGNVLGEGRYAKVLEATDYTLGYDDGQIAAKIIDLAESSSNFRDKFLPRETAIWSQLRHDHVVYLFDHYVVDSYAVLIAEYLPDGDLLAYLNNHKAVGERRGHSMVKGLYEALKYLHDKGVVHRDIKLENIMIDRDKLKLTDFGFCRSLDDPKMLIDTYCGTRDYSAPQILLDQPYDPKLADVWSLGVVVYAVVTGRLPFDDGSLYGTNSQSISATKMIEWQRARKYDFPKGVSVEFQRLIHRHLTFDESHRPSIQQLCESDWVTLGPKNNEEKLGEKAVREEFLITDTISSHNECRPATITVCCLSLLFVCLLIMYALWAYGQF